MIGQGRGVTMEPLKKIMERLSAPTGGRALFTDSIDELHGAFAELLDELSNQYLLGYPPTNATRDDRWHQIKVDVDGHHEVRARQGYRAGEGAEEDQMTARDRESCVLGRSRARVRLAGAQQPAQPPRFQASVEVTAIDVTVVDDRGKPVSGLTPADFSVRIDGSPRRVVSAEWVTTRRARRRRTNRRLRRCRPATAATSARTAAG